MGRELTRSLDLTRLLLSLLVYTTVTMSMSMSHKDGDEIAEYKYIYMQVPPTNEVAKGEPCVVVVYSETIAAVRPGIHYHKRVLRNKVSHL